MTRMKKKNTKNNFIFTKNVSSFENSTLILHVFEYFLLYLA